MKLGDIIALAKLGYKKDDIKELIEMADTAEEPISTEPESPAKEPGAAEPETSSPESDIPDKSADPDKDALKALEDQISDLKRQLEAAQKQNINTDNSAGYEPKESDQDILNNVMRNFM